VAAVAIRTGLIVVAVAGLAACSPGRPASPQPSAATTRAAVATASAPATSVTAEPTDSGGRLGPAPFIRSLWFVDRTHGFAATGTGISATADGGRTWVRVLDHPSIVQIAFVDPRHGWAVGKEQLFRTSDSGRLWRAAGEPQDPLTSVAFVSADQGWGTTNSGSVAVSADGGEHWAAQPTPGPVGSICFTGRAHGWAGGPGRVMATRDGGRHWSLAYRLPSVAEPDQGADVRCRGGSVWAFFRGSGAVSKLDYTLVRHSLGNARWTVLAHGWGFAPEAELPGAPGVPGLGDYAGPFSVLGSRVAVVLSRCVACAPTRLGLVVIDTTRRWSGDWITALDGTEADENTPPTFVDRFHGWVVASRADEGSVIAATRDGGVTWALLPTPPS